MLKIRKWSIHTCASPINLCFDARILEFLPRSSRAMCLIIDCNRLPYLIFLGRYFGVIFPPISWTGAAALQFGGAVDTSSLAEQVCEVVRVGEDEHGERWTVDTS